MDEEFLKLYDSVDIAILPQRAGYPIHGGDIGFFYVTEPEEFVQKIVSLYCLRHALFNETLLFLILG